MTARGWFLFSLMGVVWGIPLAIRQGGLTRTVRTYWRPMLAFACIEIMIPWWTLTDAERHLSSSTAGLLIAGVPIVGVAAARLFGDTERLGARRVAGLTLGLSGVAVLTVPHLTGGDARSLAEVLLTVIGYATAPVIVARHLKNVPSLHLTAACLTLAALVYAPAAAATRPSGLPSPQILAALAGLGVICTAVAFVAFLELIKEAGPTRATVITYVNPAVAVAAGAAFLDESLTPGVLAAFALILAGSVLATAGPKRTPRPVPWSTRQTSRADGRVEVLVDLPEERPGSTGQGGG